MNKLSTDALAVIHGCEVTDKDLIKLPDTQLDRPLYEEVAECLQRIGGKWHKGRKGFVFALYDPAPLLAGIQASGIMPEKNPLAFFPTPTSMVWDLMRLSDLHDLPRYKSFRVLEPSAGSGSIATIARECLQRNQSWNELPDHVLHVCEFDPLNRSILEAKGFEIVGEDFLQYQPDQPYDRIVMNPPFSVAGDALAYITHINHALTMLDPNDGVLVAIVPSGFLFRGGKQFETLRALVGERGGYIQYNNQEFKDAGTAIDTVVIWIDNDPQAWRYKTEPCENYANYYQYLLWTCLDDNYEFYKDLRDLALRGNYTQSQVLAVFDELVPAMWKQYGIYIRWDQEQRDIFAAHYDELMTAWVREAV